MSINTHAGDLRLVGGRLCLDFVNTVASHRAPVLKDYLVDYGALLRWAEHADAITPPEAQALALLAEAQPDGGRVALAAAGQLRAGLWHVCAAFAENTAFELAQLADLNALLAAAPPPALGVVGAQLRRLSPPLSDLRAPLWPVVWSAAELFASPDAARIKICAGAGCGWVFVDITPNMTRRWCSTQDCGNRMKARRHYARGRGVAE